MKMVCVCVCECIWTVQEFEMNKILYTNRNDV